MPDTITARRRRGTRYLATVRMAFLRRKQVRGRLARLLLERMILLTGMDLQGYC